MSGRTLIWQDEVNSFVTELYEYVQTHSVTFEDEDEGYADFQEFVNQRFDKFWPVLYTADYRNYN
jgi:hypothetical protein